MDDGEEDGHFGFAGGGEAVGEGFESRVAAPCGECGHEEDATEVTVALGADGGGGPQAGAGLADARGDGQPGGGGASVGEVARDFGGEPGGGPQTDAFDLAERSDVLAQLGGGLDVRGDLRLEAGDFLFQGTDDAGEAFGNERIGDGFSAVALGLQHGGQVGGAAQQGPQELLGGTGQLPRPARCAWRRSWR